ncbi:MAG: hypothetical protein ABI947_00960 [Chloroflexota bacterium]
MATISAAITALATFGGTVPGIHASYDLTTLPEKITRDKLACAVVVPEVTGGQNAYRFQTVSFMGSAPQVTFTVSQLVLFDTVDNKRVKAVLPGLITLLDNYLAALKALPFLSSTSAPAIHRAVTCTPTIGTFAYGDIEYHGIEFTHSLMINL